MYRPAKKSKTSKREGEDHEENDDGTEASSKRPKHKAFKPKGWGDEEGSNPTIQLGVMAIPAQVMRYGSEKFDTDNNLKGSVVVLRDQKSIEDLLKLEEEYATMVGTDIESVILGYIDPPSRPEYEPSQDEEELKKPAIEQWAKVRCAISSLPANHFYDTSIPHDERTPPTTGTMIVGIAKAAPWKNKAGGKTWLYGLKLFVNKIKIMGQVPDHLLVKNEPQEPNWT